MGGNAQRFDSIVRVGQLYKWNKANGIKIHALHEYFLVFVFDYNLQNIALFE